MDAFPGEGARDGGRSPAVARVCSFDSDVLRFTVFFTPNHPSTPDALTVVTSSSSSCSFSGSGVTGRLLGLASTSGGRFNRPDKLRARLALPFLSGTFSAICVSFSSLGKISGSAKTILGVGLGPREGKGEETVCALLGTDGASSEFPSFDIGRPSPRLKLLTCRKRRLEDESRDRERDVDCLRLSVLPSVEGTAACGVRFESFRGLDGVTTIPRGTLGSALVSYGSGGRGLSEGMSEVESRDWGWEVSRS